MIQNLSHEIDKRLVEHLQIGNIYIHNKIRLIAEPLFAGSHRLLQNPFSDRHNQAAGFQKRYKFNRRNHAVRLAGPPKQCLGARDPQRLRMHKRLIDEVKRFHPVHHTELKTAGKLQRAPSGVHHILRKERDRILTILFGHLEST